MEYKFKFLKYALRIQRSETGYALKIKIKSIGILFPLVKHINV